MERSLLLCPYGRIFRMGWEHAACMRHEGQAKMSVTSMLSIIPPRAP